MWQKQLFLFWKVGLSNAEYQSVFRPQQQLQNFTSTLVEKILKSSQNKHYYFYYFIHTEISTDIFIDTNEWMSWRSLVGRNCSVLFNTEYW